MPQTRTPAARLASQVEKKMVATGTMARIDVRAARHLAYANSLGYATAQQAYNALGKPFLAAANDYQEPTAEVRQSVAGFVSLTGKGWDVALAFECAYDAVHDQIGKEDFLNLCEQAVKEKASATQN